MRMRLLAFFVPLLVMISPLSANIWPIPPFGRIPFPLHSPPPPPFSVFRPPPPPVMPQPPVKPRIVRCRHISYPACYLIQLPCPVACPTDCMMDCATCRPVCSCNFPGAVCQDPRFVGGDGNTFYFHGRKDQDFCLVTDSNLHVNAHFIGKRNPNLKRDFTWVQSLGILFDNHKILVSAKKTSTWDDNIDRLTISLNNTSVSLPLEEGAKWHSSTAPLVKITRTRIANGVAIEVENNFKINGVVVPISAHESRVHGYNISDEDCFAHLEIGFKFYNVSEMVDGVLGQTYRSEYVSKTRVDVAMPVMGGTRKYLSSGIFATDCAMSRYGEDINNNVNPRDSGRKYSSMSCSSGMKGNGFLCKK